ncbi:MAG TPA: hypothetical protein VJV78_30995 [Polyangiales bacterium]|nr:hypothetical protein [Polyangiales bacterium]
MATELQELVKPEKIKQAREQLARVGGELEHVDRRLRALIQERPVVTLLGAALVGHLIGRLVAAGR